MYIDVLLRWNARVNLTAIRRPEDIVTRHFGESLFTAHALFPYTGHAATACARPIEGAAAACVGTSLEPVQPGHLIDVGTGPGFPGLPIKIWNPSLRLTLIESNYKKATFLREITRLLTLTNVNVISARAETHPPATGDVVTLRAVERFDHALPTAAALAAPGGRLALLIGSSQVGQATDLAPQFHWNSPLKITGSQSRILLVGKKRVVARGEPT